MLGPTWPRLMATALSRLLKLKSKSQYQTIDVARADASKAVGWAQKMLDAASEIVRE